MLTDTRGAADGPLGERRIAIKDNTAIAAVPMMNGASVLQGHVPDDGATIVTRILDAMAQRGLRMPPIQIASSIIVPQRIGGVKVRHPSHFQRERTP